MTDKFIGLKDLGSPSEAPEEWGELLAEGKFCGEIAMVLDTAETDKPHVRDAIVKHLHDLCSIYRELAIKTERLENPEEFNVLLSVEELLFLGCRYDPPRSKNHILELCEDLVKHQQSRPFFFDRLLRLLPAYCALEDEEKDWQDLWRFYEMDENDKRFSLDALHLHAYNQPDAALWHRSKGFLLERSNKVPEDAYRFTGKEIDYTRHALTKAAPAYKKNPALQRMSLYWAWECFRFLPADGKLRSDLYSAIEQLYCYSENRNLQKMLLNRFRRPD